MKKIMNRMNKKKTNKIDYWIPMYNNEYYFINPYDGLIKNKHGKILKGRCLKEKGRIKCKYYSIKTKEGFKSIKEHRIIAEAVLKKNLSGFPIGHKNNLNDDNRFINLLIGKKNYNSKRIEIIEYKNNIPNKRYKSIREFERETGISHHTFNKNSYSVGVYRWEKDIDNNKHII